MLSNHDLSLTLDFKANLVFFLSLVILYQWRMFILNMSKVSNDELSVFTIILQSSDCSKHSVYHRFVSYSGIRKYP